MKNYKTEDIILGVGTVLLFILILAALLSFTEWGDEKNAIPRIQWQAPANPAAPGQNFVTPGSNINPGPMVNQNSMAGGFMNIAAAQRPGLNRQQMAAAGADPFLKQQMQINKELIKTIQLSEAHWQGMELLPLTNELKLKLNIPMDLTGVLVDEVTLSTLLAGIRGGDVLLTVEERPVASLEQFQKETMRLRNKNKTKVQVWRKGKIVKFKVRADSILGMAQVETAPMILAGAMRPHPYRGPCTNCHLIGDIATLKPDPDGVILPPPTIQAGARMPHRDRGPCEACHVIVP